MRDTENPADSLYFVAHDPYGRPRGRKTLGVGLGACLLGELHMQGTLRFDGSDVVPLPQTPYLRHVRHEIYGERCSFSHRKISGGVTCPRCRTSGIERLVCPIPDCRTPLQRTAVCPGCYCPDIEEVPEQLQREVLSMMVREGRILTVGQWLQVLGRHSMYEVGRRLQRSGRLRTEKYRSLTGKVKERYAITNAVEADMPRQTLRRIATGLHEVDDHHRLVIGIADAVGLTSHTLSGMLPADTANLLRHVRDLGSDLQVLIEQTRAAVDDTVLVHAG